jgi:hypothetical protein
MTVIPENIKFLLFGFGPEMNARMALIASCMGLVTMILGIIAAATDHKLGLGATNWFLLTITLFIFGLSMWFSAYFGAKEGYTK